MYNTVILWKRYGELSQLEYGNLIFGDSEYLEEVARFKIEDEELAKIELSKYRCEYWEQDSYVKSVIMGEEYSLEYCTYNDEGEFIEGFGYDLAEIDCDSEYVLDVWQNKLVKKELYIEDFGDNVVVSCADGRKEKILFNGDELGIYLPCGADGTALFENEDEAEAVCEADFKEQMLDVFGENIANLEEITETLTTKASYIICDAWADVH